MVKNDKVLVLDIDGTITIESSYLGDYSGVKVNQKFLDKIIELKRNGFWIVLYTSRNMQTYEGNVGMILANTAPILIKWLNENNIPFDELHFGKPWCGNSGFYVDDKAIRPKEFLNNTIPEIFEILKRDKF